MMTSNEEFYAAVKKMQDQKLIEWNIHSYKNERKYLFEFIATLSEIYRRELYLKEGFSSLFKYCQLKFGYSEGSSYRRSIVAKAVIKYPNILNKISEGKLTLSNAAIIAKVATKNNILAALEKGGHFSKNELEKEYLLNKNRFEKEFIRKLPNSTNQEVDSYSINFRASKEFLANLDRLKVVLGNKLDCGSISSIFDFLASEYLKKYDIKNKKTGLNTKHINEKSRYIPLGLRHNLLKESDFQCSFISSSGVRCSEKKWLEVDHIVPFAKGGPTNFKNLQILCKNHNLYKAKIDFLKKV